jgi:hypothetical protein
MIRTVNQGYLSVAMHYTAPTSYLINSTNGSEGKAISMERLHGRCSGVAAAVTETPKSNSSGVDSGA